MALTLLELGRVFHLALHALVIHVLGDTAGQEAHLLAVGTCLLVLDEVSVLMAELCEEQAA